MVGLRRVACQRVRGEGNPRRVRRISEGARGDEDRGIPRLVYVQGTVDSPRFQEQGRDGATLRRVRETIALCGVLAGPIHAPEPRLRGVLRVRGEGHQGTPQTDYHPREIRDRPGPFCRAEVGSSGGLDATTGRVATPLIVATHLWVRAPSEGDSTLRPTRRTGASPRVQHGRLGRYLRPRVCERHD